jgi:hypothetical protein
MHKFTFLIGAGVGFVAGSRLGTGPYEQLESAIARVAGRPEVKERVEQIKRTAGERVGDAVHKAGARLPGRPVSREEGATPVAVVADPSAYQPAAHFGTAAQQEEPSTLI